MPPYDTLIAPAIRRLYPKAVVNVTPMARRSQTLASSKNPPKKSAPWRRIRLHGRPGLLPVRKPEAFPQRLLLDHELVPQLARSSGMWSAALPSAKTDSTTENPAQSPKPLSFDRSSRPPHARWRCLRIGHVAHPTSQTPKLIPHETLQSPRQAPCWQSRPYLLLPLAHRLLPGHGRPLSLRRHLATMASMAPGKPVKSKPCSAVITPPLIDFMWHRPKKRPLPPPGGRRCRFDDPTRRHRR